jgi:hypothetical protein
MSRGKKRSTPQSNATRTFFSNPGSLLRYTVRHRNPGEEAGEFPAPHLRDGGPMAERHERPNRPEAKRAKRASQQQGSDVLRGDSPLTECVLGGWRVERTRVISVRDLGAVANGPDMGTPLDL